MRLAIADPPYLGRAERWYGPTGRGVAGGRGRADTHPDAAVWDRPDSHTALVAQLEAFDGWALFCGVWGLRHVLPVTPPDTVVLSWTVTNAQPSGSRILTGWEPVLVRVPVSRRAHGTGPATRSAMAAAAPRRQFVGAKPESVTHWILDVLAYDPDTDELTDLFPGSGAIAAAAAQLRMPL